MGVIDLSANKPVAGTNGDAPQIANGFQTLQNLVNGNIDTNNIAPAAAIKGSQLATGISGPPGTRLVYQQFTSNVSITATSAATATTIVTAGAFTFDGATLVLVEFFSPKVLKGTTFTAVSLWDGSTDLGELGEVDGATGVALRLACELTPSAAAHTFSARAWVDAGTGTVVGGAGGAGVRLPGFIRITKA